MRFFADNNIAPSIADALNVLSQKEGVDVVALRQKFDRRTTDAVWLAKLSQEGDWVVLSGDFSITRKPHERLAWQESGLTCFFLQAGWLHIPFWQQAWKLVKWWPDVIETARRFESGHSFLIPVRGSKIKILRQR